MAGQVREHEAGIFLQEDAETIALADLSPTAGSLGRPLAVGRPNAGDLQRP